MNNKIKIAIVGAGNCAKSLVEGVQYYSVNTHQIDGMMRYDIGGYTANDLEFVCAFDIDQRKIGLPLGQALKQQPNCSWNIVDEITSTAPVYPAPVIDGYAQLMDTYNKSNRFSVSDELRQNTDILFPFTKWSVASYNTWKRDILRLLKQHEVEILINYLPVGSQLATEFWADICLESKISLVNCIPVFIASNSIWEQRFINAGIPIIGDDMRSQFGASVLSQILQELAFDRGHVVKCHIQRNVGGNTDFLNMEDKSRLKSKKISKENVIRSQNDIRGISTDNSFLHAGPSEYISYFGDNKVANFHLELAGFGGSPVILDAQLSVQDSPNSGGVVIDAIRYLKVAREMGIVGALRGPSAFTQKTPPQQMMFHDAQFECTALANRQYTNITKTQLYTGEHINPTVPTEIIDWLQTPYKHFPKILSNYISLNDSSLCDITCGDNIQLPQLKSKFKQIYSMNYNSNNPNVINANILNIPLKDNEVDVVFSFETIEHLQPHEAKAAINELIRVAKQYVIIGSVNLDGPDYIDNKIPIFKGGLYKYHYNEYDMNRWSEEFDGWELYHSTYNNGKWTIEPGLSTAGYSNFALLKI